MLFNHENVYNELFYIVICCMSEMFTNDEDNKFYKKNYYKVTVIYFMKYLLICNQCLILC